MNIPKRATQYCAIPERYLYRKGVSSTYLGQIRLIKVTTEDIYLCTDVYSDHMSAWRTSLLAIFYVSYYIIDTLINFYSHQASLMRTLIIYCAPYTFRKRIAFGPQSFVYLREEPRYVIGEMESLVLKLERFE